MNLDQEMQQAYDRIAVDFAVRNAAMPPILAALAEILGRHVGRDGLIADIGCGHGRDSAWLERAMKRVIGLDLSFQMLKQAQRITRGRLAQMNMKALGVRDGCVDGIWCCAALLHLPKAQAPAAMSEFRRILQPGGMLIVSVQQGSFEGPRYSEREGVTRYFSEYEPDEMKALFTYCNFRVQSQSSDTGGWHGRWLQTIGVAL